MSQNLLVLLQIGITVPDNRKHIKILKIINKSIEA